jgi:AmmeMemoRadiSam system protein B
MNLRKSVFSGSWYPASDKACEDQIQEFLEAGKNQTVSIANPIGGIVPHAGWFFSGSIACNVIHRISEAASPDVVVVFGMHLHSGSPRSIMPEGEWETPFGTIAVDTTLAGELTRRHSFQMETPTRFHAGQHHRASDAVYPLFFQGCPGRCHGRAAGGLRRWRWPNPLWRPHGSWI